MERKFDLGRAVDQASNRQLAAMLTLGGEQPLAVIGQGTSARVIWPEEAPAGWRPLRLTSAVEPEAGHRPSAIGHPELVERVKLVAIGFAAGFLCCFAVWLVGGMR